MTTRAAPIRSVALELGAQWTSWRVHEFAGHVHVLDKHLIIHLHALARNTIIVR